MHNIGLSVGADVINFGCSSLSAAVLDDEQIQVLVLIFNFKAKSAVVQGRNE